MLNNQTVGGVIWVTGHSSAGKTSVGRIVASMLNDARTPSVFLDGDDLRGILGNKWGYTAEERRELARVYFRFCSHLASQNITVVISAVAMYDEIFAWFKQNVPHAMLVYLDVPEATRRTRDAATKGVYADIKGNAGHYDVPSSPDLTLHNLDGTDLNVLAAEIISTFSSIHDDGADRGKSKYWDSFYAKRTGALKPSPFAVHVHGQIPEARGFDLLEVGCGNGRDSVYFAQAGCSVTAIDTSEAAIAACRDTHGDAALFVHGKVAEIGIRPGSFDAAYSRFVLHAMTLDEELDALKAIAEALKPGGRFFVECRSINDPLARKGEVLSPTERIDGHYRRFIVADDLLQRVADVGLQVESIVESNGLAVFGDEDPVVIRLVASKPA